MKLRAEPRCRSCGTLILWVRTAAGRTMPLDAAITRSLDPKAVLFTPEGKRLEPGPGQELIGHLPHWASCPDAQAWRTPR